MPIVMSPINPQVLRADQSALQDDFSTDSQVQIFQLNGMSFQSIMNRSFSASFLCTDWAFSDHIAAGGEQGQLLITKPNELKSTELI